MKTLPPRWHRPRPWPLSQNCGQGQRWVAIVTFVHEGMPLSDLVHVYLAQQMRSVAHMNDGGGKGAQG